MFNQPGTYKKAVLIICLCLLSGFPVFSLASGTYYCSGRFNTASDYLHIYVVNDRAEGGFLSWNGTQFNFQEDPVWIYAEYIGDTRTDVVYIEKQSMQAMFFSILPGLMLHAKGKCKIVPEKHLEFRKKYLPLDKQVVE